MKHDVNTPPQIQGNNACAPKKIDIANRTPDTESSTATVPILAIKKYPVRNVPTMEPTAPQE